MKSGLPKKYAKMGFKRGWRAYKASRRKSSSLKSGRKRRDYKMPRRKRRSPRRYSYRRKTRVKRTLLTNQKLIGMALTSTAEGFLDNMLAQTGIGISDDIIKLGLGYYLAKKKGGFVGGIGLGLLSRGLGNVVGNLTQGINLFGGTAGSTAADNVVV